MDVAAMIGVLSLVDNRVVETLKRALSGRIKNDDLAGVIVLLLSFIVGTGEAALLPAVNLFTQSGATPLVSDILTGVIFGGLANGIDWGGKLGAAAIGWMSPATPPTSTPPGGVG